MTNFFKLIAIFIMILEGIFLPQEKSKYKNLSNNELADLFYNTSKESFVNEKMANYRFPYKGTDTLDNALLDVSSMDQSAENKTVSLDSETKSYYVIFQKYTSDGHEYENLYVYFKNDVLNIEKKIINFNVIEESELKELLDLYVYLLTSDTGSAKLLDSSIQNVGDKYIYKYYQFKCVYGDYGINDAITLYEKEIIIDKETGKMQESEKSIGFANGKLG